MPYSCSTAVTGGFLSLNNVPDNYTDGGKLTLTILPGEPFATYILSSTSAGEIARNQIETSNEWNNVAIEGVNYGTIYLCFRWYGGYLYPCGVGGEVQFNVPIVQEIVLDYTPSPITTTTTTTPPITTTTTTTQIGPTTTTTTTLTPTTTTTTTTPLSPIRVVETVFMEKTENGYIERIISDASDSEDTKNTPFAKAFNFGTIAPKEISKTLPIFLRLPKTKAIRNIKIGLINSGGIAFDTDIFGVTTSQELRDNIVPETYFQGINAGKTSDNEYNISVANNSEITSQYVYLNVNLPTDNFLGEGVVRIKWFFDYYD